MSGPRSGPHAERDLFFAGRDQHFYGVNGPAFILEAVPVTGQVSVAQLAALREQPSTLLNARRAAIAFTGREEELEALASWRELSALRGALLIHAAGGQGKTRLAAHAAGQAAAAGWTVGWARHRDDTPNGGQALSVDGAEPLMLVLDYAERWPTADLQALLVRAAGHSGRVRVLLLARSQPGWAATEAVCDDLDIATETPRLLPPPASTVTGRRRLFDQACARFAEIYELDPVPAFTPPGRLDDAVYALTLGVHMAALAVVDAHAHQQQPPSGSADLSRYLLGRERRYWARLHGEQQVTAAARTTFLAALAGAQTPPAATALLDRCALPDATGLSAQQLLDAHARCYPPSDPGTLLEPLYPDRLAEDFIALTLPGPSPGSHADAWAAHLLTTTHPTSDGAHLTVLGPLLARGTDQNPAACTSRALIFLAAAAARFDAARDQLRTLLAADPALPVDAGGAALLAITPHTDADLATTISQHLPERDFDLDPAAGALTEHLTHPPPPPPPPGGKGGV